YRAYLEVVTAFLSHVRIKVIACAGSLHFMDLRTSPVKSHLIITGSGTAAADPPSGLSVSGTGPVSFLRHIILSFHRIQFQGDKQVAAADGCRFKSAAVDLYIAGIITAAESSLIRIC